MPQGLPPLKIIDCPRDAMQGIHRQIPTATKVAYVEALLAVGFDTLDVGSFVSPKAIPQMADSGEVLRAIDRGDSPTKLLTIVANRRGAATAVTYPQVDVLGYPFSVSETFQIRNTNATISESLERLDGIAALCRDHGKDFVVYLSMGFGNPYGDPWNVQVVSRWVEVLAERGIRTLQLSDTIGVSTAASISYLFGQLIARYPDLEIGAHLHTRPDEWFEKVDSAYQSGCRRFDGALRGYGGCPMAADALTGNMPTEHLVDYLSARESIGLDTDALAHALALTTETFAEA